MFEREYADPYLIAEIGMNYEGSMQRAKAMVDAVARAGAHAAKFQTYKAETLASVSDSPSYWDTNKESTTSQFELFRRFDGFGEAEYVELAEYCQTVGIDFLSTPFDLESVAWLAPLMPAVKIASADLTNVPLLRRVAATGKPIILSVGASTHEEIDWALAILENAGSTEIALLHCVLRYPTPPENANLLAMVALIEKFGSRATIGYSDHVAPEESGKVPALLAAATLGARVLEKHFTDDRTAQGNDHYHAFDEDSLRGFVSELDGLRVLLGTGYPDIASQSAAVGNARRRIFLSKDCSEGDLLTEDVLIALRADTGIEIAHWDSIVGQRLRLPKLAGEALFESDVSLHSL